MKYTVKYTPLILFIAFVVKMMVTTVTLDNALFCLILGSIAAFYEYKSQSKEIDALKKSFDELKVKMEKDAQEMGDLRTYLSTVKLNNAMQRNVR